MILNLPAGLINNLNSARCSSGMTLLEVLLAMVMLSTVVSMVAMSLSGSFAVVETTRLHGELYYRAQVAFQRISEDISSAALVEGIEFVGSKEDQGSGRADTVTFISTAHVVFDPQKDHHGMAFISYYVEEDPENEQELLLLRADRLLTPTDDDKDTVVEKEGGFLLSDRLRSVRFSYFNLDGDEEDEWTSEVDETNADEVRRLPVTVRCVLEFWIDHEEETSVEFSTRILLPVGLIDDEDNTN